MVTLNLETKDKSQERIKAYLENNASDILADKINNGVTIEKDGKQLTNKKDLDGFMKYACDEARKQAAKGANSACIEDAVVYGWAIHYFEEDSLEGKLFNPDGTEYKPPVPIKTPTSIPVKPVMSPKPKEPNLFDMIAAVEKQEPKEPITETVTELVTSAETCKDDEPTIDQIADSLQQALEQKQQPPVEPTPQPKPKNELYEKYITYVNRYPDSVIAMRVGDFYEVFGKKATLIADKAGLTLTGRDMGLEQRIPMVGFPHHASEAYFKKIRQSYSLVIVDDDGERKLEEFGLEDILDGDNELTEDEERQIYDDLTLEEMEQFDGDIQEPTGIPKTVLSEAKKAEMKYILTKDDIVCDPAVLDKLHKILGDVLA